MQAAIALVGSGMGDYALAIGMDTAQGRPAMRWSTPRRRAARPISWAPLRTAWPSWKARTRSSPTRPISGAGPTSTIPQHAGRFTGEPAYFRHSLAAAQHLMDALGYTPADFDLAVFHQPNVRFPVQAASDLGFKREQIAAGLLVNEIGNTYAGSSMLGLSAVLDVAQPGQRILQVSFGSGAGSDAFCWCVTERIAERRDRAPSHARLYRAPPGDRLCAPTRAIARKLSMD